MRALLAAVILFAGTLAILAQTPATRVIAQDKAPAPAKPRASAPAPAPAAKAKPATSPAKEADIRALMQLTGTADLGEDMRKTATEQLRVNFTKAYPATEKTRQFTEAFLAGFQKRFDPKTLTEQIIPLYEKYLTAEDVKGLLQFYRSPLGERSLKFIPQIFQEAQAVGFELGQKAARESLQELQAQYPDYMPGANQNQAKP
jgi:hypothetical protein